MKRTLVALTTVPALAGCDGEPAAPPILLPEWFPVLSHPDPYPVPGLEDSVLVPGNATVEIEAYFDNPGRWMAHCHILEHAELGMMSEIVVRPAE